MIQYPVATAYELIGKKIADLDKKILAAITSGNTPLAEKLSIERNAALKLKEAIDKVKEAFDQGWDMDQSDLPAMETMILKSAGLVVPDKKDKSKSPFTGRGVDKKPTTGPSESTKEQESLDKQKKEDWKNAEFQIADTLNTSITNMIMAKQNAQHEHKLKLIEKEREAELSNKNLTEKQKEEINKKYDAKISAEKQKAWKKQRNADAISTTIATILAVMKAAPVVPLMVATAVAGAASVIGIMTQPVPEFAGGRYQVTGAQTGRQYTADYTGPARTGLYTKPSLVAETGHEIIIEP
jgi:hypothetical protein